MWALVHTLVVMGQLQEHHLGVYESKAECRQAATAYHESMPADEKNKMQTFECIKTGENI